MKLEFHFSLELTEAEMASGSIGGLDFSQLISAVNNVRDTLTGVVNRLQNVAPQAGSTDAASSAAAQTEINALADQLNTAVKSLNQVNQAAQAAASQQPAPSTPAPATPVAGQPAATEPSIPLASTPAAPATTGASPATPGTAVAAPATNPATPAGPTETGANTPTPPPPGTTTPGA